MYKSVIQKSEKVILKDFILSCFECAPSSAPSTWLNNSVHFTHTLIHHDLHTDHLLRKQFHFVSFVYVFLSH